MQGLSINSRTDEELGDLVNYLHQYDFEVRYKPGMTNIEADCLSRNPVLDPGEGKLKEIIRMVNVLTLEEIKGDQENVVVDERIDVEREGVIYRKVKDNERVLLTEETGKEIIAKVHKHYGHIGAKHMLNLIKPYYFFKNMQKKVQKKCTTVKSVFAIKKENPET